MKAKVTQEKLAHALTIVGRVASSRATLPVLANVLIKATKSQITLTATNLEIAITQIVPGKIDNSGSITVPARLFSDYVNSLPGGTIEMEAKNNNLHLSSTRFKSTINGISADEFPSIPKIKNPNRLTIDAKEMKKALQQTVFAASNDETRPVLTGIYLHTHDKRVYVTATDSYRLAEKQLPVNTDEKISLIVPASAMGDLLRIIGDGDGEVTVSYNDSQAQFSFASSDLITRQIAGDYPKYRQLLPKDTEVEVTLSKDEMVEVVKVAALFARESAGGVTIEVNEGEFSVTSVASQVGENTSRTKAETKGSGKITLNSRYLLDALNVIDSSKVKFGFSGKVSPSVLRPDGDEGYTHVIMPLKS